MGRNNKAIEWTPDMVDQLAKDLWEYATDPTNLWLSGFIAKNNLSYDRLKDLAEKNPDLEEVYYRARQLLEERIMTGGLRKQFNAQLAVFALSNLNPQLATSRGQDSSDVKIVVEYEEDISDERDNED